MKKQIALILLLSAMCSMLLGTEVLADSNTGPSSFRVMREHSLTDDGVYIQLAFHTGYLERKFIFVNSENTTFEVWHSVNQETKFTSVNQGVFATDDSISTEIPMDFFVGESGYFFIWIENVLADDDLFGTVTTEKSRVNTLYYQKQNGKLYLSTEQFKGGDAE